MPLEIRTYLYIFGLSSRKKKFKYILIINCCGQIEDETDIINNGCFHSLSCDFLPLKKYSIKKLCNYNTKEISVITI